MGGQGPRNPGHWDLSSHSICTACCLKAHWQMSSLALGLPWDRTTILHPVKLRETLTQGHGCFKSSLICSYEDGNRRPKQNTGTPNFRNIENSSKGYKPTRQAHLPRGRGQAGWAGPRSRVQLGPAATGGSTEAGRSAGFGARSSSWLPLGGGGVGGGVGGRHKGPPFLQPHSSAALEDFRF